MKKRLRCFLKLVFFFFLASFAQAQSAHNKPIPAPGGTSFPECEVPANARVGKIGSTYVSLEWDEPEDAYGKYSYQLRFREAGSFSWKTIEVRRRQGVMVQHLLPGRSYEIELRRVCSSELQLFSEWAGVGVTRTTSGGNNRSLPNEVCNALTEGIFAEISSDAVAIAWDGPTASEGAYWYQIRYRYTQEGTTTGWVEESVREGSYLLVPELENGATYEFEIRLLWGEGEREGEAIFTCEWISIGDLSINGGEVDDEEPAPPITLPTFECGDNFTGVYADPRTSLSSADPGDVFNINGFPLLLTEVTGGGGYFSGEGIVPLPFNQRTVKVSFSGIIVNNSGQVVSGTLTGISDDPANHPDLTLDTISIGGGICIPPQQSEGFDANGIHSATGQPWDENGFGANGQYVQQPPYPGWSPGDPYDSSYDPNGFDSDGIHTITGTEYNENGCNQQGFDADGQPCDPSGPGPYYWMTPAGNEPPTQAGIILAEQVEEDIRPMLIDAWNLYLGRANDSITVNRAACDAIRGEMNNLMTVLGYDRSFIFGQNDQYFAEGMSELFTAEPKPLALNIARDPQHEELEDKHVALWHCDTALMKFICSRDFINAQLQSAAVDAKVADLLDQISHFSEEDAATYSDPNNLIAWIQGIVTNEIKQACNIGSSGSGGVGLVPFPGGKPGQNREAWASIRPDLSPDADMSLLLADLGEEKAALLQSLELEEEDISFLFRQGFQQIGGVGRAFYLEALAKRQAMLPPAGGNLLPVVVEKEILGRVYKIYLDNITFTTQGATLDAYFVLEIPTTGDRLVFKALGIPFGPTGMTVDTRLELGTNVSIRINNAARLNILGTADTYVEWDCEGFAGMGLDAEIEFCREYIVPLDSELEVKPEPERAKAYFTVQMPAWGEFIAQLNFDDFAITGLEDIKWQVHNARLDFSESQTPSDIAFPANYGSPFVSAAGQPSPLWKGFYLEELTVTLPDNLTAQEMGQQQGGTGASVTISVQDVIIDDRGVTGKASVANLMPLSDGRHLGGWAFSIDTFSISVVANALAGVGFNGLLHVPIFRSGPSNSAPITEADCLKYQAVVQPGNLYNFAIHPASDTTFHVPLWVGQANIRKNSSVSVTYGGGDFHAIATLYGDIEIDGLGNNVNVEVPRITFEGVTLSNRAPYFSPGVWGFPNSIGAKMGGFGISLENLALTHTDNPEEVALNFGMLINLINDDIDITAGGGFQLVGELDQSSGRQIWNFKQFKVSDISIDASWAGVNRITGELSFYENNAQFGNGFRGMVSVRFAGMGEGGGSGVGIDAVAQFGSKDDFKYFFVDAMVHLNPGIPIGPAINIRGFGGGAYYRMSRDAQGSYVSLPASETGAPSLPALGQSLSGVVYVPDRNAGLGLKATVALATSKEEVFNANATFEIAFSAGGGLSTIRFYGNARFMDGLSMSTG
ncbi:MAG: fibronectin type III domain-containing protein [Lewinellaceae bacterium]|nr:fibronectin type III domain-containing protein [Lewinellaceae bacterium]